MPSVHGDFPSALWRLRRRSALPATLLFACAAVADLQPAVFSGEVQTDRLTTLAKDRFDRPDTEWQSAAETSAVGLYSNDWRIVSQSWKISSAQVTMRRDNGTGLLMWQPDGTLNTSGRTFGLQALLTLGAAASSDWTGLAFNIQDAANYYVLRYSGAGNMQLLRIRDGAVSAILYSGNFTHTAGRSYQMTVSSGQARTFHWSLTDRESGATVLSETTTDTETGFSDGSGALYSNSNYVQADDFRLENREPLAVAKTVKGAPALLQDGAVISPDSFCANATATNAITKEEFRKAATNGLDLLFARRLCVSQDTGDGLFLADKEVLDAGIQALLSDNPDARIILDVGGLHPPGTWYAYHNQEPKLKDANGNRSVFPDSSSTIYFNAASNYVADIVRYVESRPYAESVAGYQIAVFDGGEFQLPAGYYGYSDAVRSAFQRWLETRYTTVTHLQTAWNDPTLSAFAAATVPAVSDFTSADWGAFRDPSVRRNVIDFSEFWQDKNAGFLLDLCRIVKETSSGNPLTGAFYGYILETGQAFYKGHHALRKVLDSPCVDFLAAPYSYVYRAPVWLGAANADIGAGAYHGPADSILSNGKFFFSEDDSRTYLTTDDQKSFFTNVTGTVAHLQRNRLINFCRGTGLWRLDLYGDGWYNSTELMQELGLQKRLDERMAADPDRSAGYAPDVALIIDEKSSFYVATLSDTNAGQRLGISMFLRDHLCRGGVNYGVYLLSDLIAGRVPDCSVYLFAGTYKLTRTDRNWIDENLKRDGKTLVWFYGTGLYDETGWGLDRIRSLTELDVQESPDTAPSSLEASELFAARVSNPGQNTTAITGQPEWYVQNPGTNAQVLGSYVHGTTRRPALVMENKGAWTTLYAGALRLDPRWALGLMRMIGVHQYLNTDETVPVYAGHGIVGIWPTTNMTGTVQLKAASDVYDLFTGELLHTNVTGFPVDLQPWETKGYKLQPPSVRWIPGTLGQWQTGYFQPSEITSGLAGDRNDPDDDGNTNYCEFIAGTDPRNPQSRLALQWIAMPPQIAFNSVTGRIYRTYTRTNLLTGTWIPLSAHAGNGTAITIAATNLQQVSFYRLDAHLP
jgi:hypothetical protein